MFSDREIMILKALLFHRMGILGKTLAALCKVSDRTIRNDIRKLNDTLTSYSVKISADIKSGYYLDERGIEVVNELLASSDLNVLANPSSSMAVFPNTFEERAFFECLMLAYNHDYLTIEELADMIFVSKTTVRNDMNTLQEIINEVGNLELRIVPLKGVRLSGLESRKRLLLSKMLHKNLDKHFDYVKSVFAVFVKQTPLLYNLYDVFITYFEAKNIIFMGNDLLFYTMEVLTSIDRFEKGYHLENTYSFPFNNSVGLPYSDIDALFGIQLSQEEKEYLLDSLSYKRLIDSNNHRHFTDASIDEIENEFFEEIKRQYNVAFPQSSSSYRNTLKLHINALLQRIRHNSVNTNNQELIEDVKSRYPFSFELASCIIPVIRKRFNVTLGEEELTYIAIHLSLLLEVAAQKVNALIVAGSSYAESMLIEQNISVRFHNKIHFVGTYPLYQLNNVLKEHPEIELILSTIPCNVKSNSAKVLQISSTITSNDIYNLEAFFSQKLSSLGAGTDSGEAFDPNLFYVYEDKNEYEILDQMIGDLYQYGYIDNKSVFFDSLMKRESIYPTVYGRIWVPHPLEPLANKTVFSIGLIRRSEAINLIILCCVRRDETIKYQKIFDRISKLLTGEKSMAQLLRAESLSEFTKLFLEI